MNITTNIALTMQTPLSQLGEVDFLTDLPKAMYVMVMIVVLFLPLLLIPYIFVKMGSVAGKVQASLNSVGRGLRKGATRGVTRTAMKEGKGFAKDRGMEWAAKRANVRPNSSTGKLANYALNRQRVKESRSAAVTKALEEAHYDKILRTPGYAERAAGIGGAQGVERLRTKAQGYKDAVENKEASERRGALITSWQQNRIAPDDLQKELHRAYAANEVDTAAAATTHLATAYGGKGRAMVEETLENLHTINPTPDVKMTNAVENVVGNELYSTLVTKIGATAKGSFETDASTGQTRFKLNSLGALSTEQLAQQDAKHLMKHFSDMSAQDAIDILSNQALESKITDKYARALINVRKAGFTAIPPDLEGAIKNGSDVPDVYR